jgi:hypothetical protein
MPNALIMLPVADSVARAVIQETLEHGVLAGCGEPFEPALPVLRMNRAVARFTARSLGMDEEGANPVGIAGAK